MSRTMQLGVEVNAHYQRSFAETYPNLARRLETLTSGMFGSDPSLFEICRRLDELIERVAETELGKLLEAEATELGRSQRRVEELLADWKLADADQLLYRMEDRFDALESELGRG